MASYETDIESKVCALALELFSVFSIKISKAQENGYPDRIFLIPGGAPLFIEFKRSCAATPSAQQLLMHRRLEHAGYAIQVHHTITGALAAIQAACVEAAAVHAARR